MGLLLVYFYERDQDAGRYAYYGVMGLRHRGYKASYAVLAADGFRLGEADPWSEWSLPSGFAAVVAIAPSAKLGLSKGSGLSAVAAVDGGCPASRLARLALTGKGEEAAHALASHEEYSPCAAVVLRSDGLFIAGRGRKSRRPLSIGGYGFESLYAATETAPISLMGGAVRHDLDAGEVVYGSQFELERVHVKGERRTSLMEYVYVARPDSLVDGVNVYVFRREMGRRLARHHDAAVDIVTGVPETAIPYAIGYAEEKSAKFEHGFTSSLGRRRTAVLPLGYRERLIMLSLKLNPVPEIFKGKSVAIVDDSVVTGLTLKVVIQRLRRAYGAREVHVAVSSPKVTHACPFSVQSFNPQTLLARHVSDAVLERVLDADSVAWLPLREATSYLRGFGIEPCTSCIGEAP
ncbi:MAG: phosphoribosyltransferase family protein [Thermoproteota archaeon]